MFTFSFGSAFAAAPVSGTFSKALAEQYFDIAMEEIEEEGGIAINGYYVDYATIEEQRADVLAAILDFDERIDGYVNNLGGIQSVLSEATEGEDAALELVVAQYAKDEAEVLGILSALNVADYSAEKISASKLAVINTNYTDFNGATYQDFVQYLIDGAVKNVNAANTMTVDSAIGAYVTAFGTLDDIIVEAKEGYTVSGTTINVNNTTALVAEKAYIGANSAAVGLGVYELNAKFVLDTSDELGAFKTTAVEAGKTNDAADIAVVKAEIAKEYAAYITTAGKTAAQLKDAANLKLVLDVLAEEGIVITGEPATLFDDATVDANAAAVKAAIKAVEEVQAYADKMIAEKNEANATVRDAADVQDIVDEYTIYKYAGAVGQPTTGYTTYTDDNVKDAMSIIYNDLTAEALAFEKKAVEKAVEQELAKYEYEETYYAPEFAKVKALADEYLAAVNALTEFETNGSNNFATLKTKYDNAVNLVKKASVVDGLPGVSDLVEIAKTYYELYDNTLKGDNKLYDDENGYKKLDKEVKALVGASDARTKTAIVALGDQLAALVRTLPTIAQVEAAEEAAEEAVKALPTTVKISDRATIEAAKAALKEYKTLTTVAYDDDGKTALAVTKLLYAYNNEFTASAKVVDKTDKAAVTALRNEIKQVARDFATADTYAAYLAENLSNGVFNTVYTTTLGGYLTAIHDAAEAAVEKAINAIPVNVTEAAEPAVKAARAAYDAFVAEYTNANIALANEYYSASDDDGFVADDFAYDELVRAEAALGLNDNSEEIAKLEAIASVEGLKITAKSSAKKGSITVKWTVEGDDANVQYYEIRKSTKKNSGFGTKPYFTTEKTSYKNTKGLEAGTRYYYKVRAVAEIDGEVYTSDWSNKAYRVAK